MAGLTAEEVLRALNNQVEKIHVIASSSSSIQRHYHTAELLYQQGISYHANNDIERAYVQLKKFLKLYLIIISTHKSFNAPSLTSQKEKYKKISMQVLNRLTLLKSSIHSKYPPHQPQPKPKMKPKPGEKKPPVNLGEIKLEGSGGGGSEVSLRKPMLPMEGLGSTKQLDRFALLRMRNSPRHVPSFSNPPPLDVPKSEEPFYPVFRPPTPPLKRRGGGGERKGEREMITEAFVEEKSPKSLLPQHVPSSPKSPRKTAKIKPESSKSKPKSKPKPNPKPKPSASMTRDQELRRSETISSFLYNLPKKSMRKKLSWNSRHVPASDECRVKHRWRGGKFRAKKSNILRESRKENALLYGALKNGLQMREYLLQRKIASFLTKVNPGKLKLLEKHLILEQAKQAARCSEMTVLVPTTIKPGQVMRLKSPESEILKVSVPLNLPPDRRFKLRINRSNVRRQEFKFRNRMKRMKKDKRVRRLIIANFSNVSDQVASWVEAREFMDH
ncbi:hypothetical protein AAMO2058_000998300 [Amorphochlora amoebiformis]